MKIVKVIFALMLVMSLSAGMPATGKAEVMMTAVVSKMGFDMLPSAMFTMDDWLSNPNLWSITLTNTAEGNKTVKRLVLGYALSNPVYGDIVKGEIRVVGVGVKYFRDTLVPGETYVLVNTMFTETTRQVTTESGFNDAFVDEATRIGFLPEGTYEFSFWIIEEESWYEDKDDPSKKGDPVEGVEPIEESIDIKSPEPPELVTPEQNADDVQAIPRFVWHEPLTTDFSQLRSVNRTLEIFYTLSVWKMFESDGTVLDQETAITRIPIWEVSGLISNSLDFDPGMSREELVSGRSYCWQVQAFDGTGRVISQTNEGKSDVWQFTIRFTPLTINQPILFYPLRFNWTPAQTGGGVVLYDVFIADNIDFSSAYFERGLVTTSFTYPGNAPKLDFGVGYYIKVQATDDAGLPLGEPITETFTLPSMEATLSSPADEEVVPTRAPMFRWQGEADFNVVRVFDEESGWSYMSGGIEGNSWTYDGEELKAGVTYSWNVTPSNEQGDLLGEPSETWTFALPPEDQITLISQVNTRIETVFPDFSWNRLTSATGDNVVYRIIITDENGNTIHSADEPSTSYTYPTDATGLEYAKRYNWSVGAVIAGEEVGIRSEPAWFVTPFVETEGEEVTITEVEEAIKLVLGDYPQFEKFADKILAGIQGPEGPITPGQLLEYIDEYKIVNVTAK